MPDKALDVALHFHRIANDDTCSPEMRYFLTGRSFDIFTHENNHMSTPHSSTTVLHEAIKASNSPLVEYLVATRFNRSALELDGNSALDLATEAESANSIASLLGKAVDSPIGWKAIQTPNKPPICIWRETSIKGYLDAVTFITPTISVSEANGIALGRIDGQGPVYRLDPFRFLKPPTSGILSKYRPATKAAFGDEWYEKDIEAVAEKISIWTRRKQELDVRERSTR